MSLLSIICLLCNLFLALIVLCVLCLFLGRPTVYGWLCCDDGGRDDAFGLCGLVVVVVACVAVYLCQNDAYMHVVVCMAVCTFERLLLC